MTRARDLRIPFAGSTGKWNAITDIAGLQVGYATLWTGSGALSVGAGPVRTGITAVLPRGRHDKRPCFGASFALNGSGEVTGLTWLDDRGLFDGPILITNTHSVGVVRDAAIQWMRLSGWDLDWSIPLVGETYDGRFSDINGGHIRSEHVFAALDGAHSGPISEGNVGGGAGMISYEYKGGTGTASRTIESAEGSYTVAALVQSNYGKRSQLRIGGVPVGAEFQMDLPQYLDPTILSAEVRARYSSWCPTMDGSIIAVVVTDAPLLPHQLKRLAKRPALAIGRLGGVGAATSGDIFLAISTANAAVIESGPSPKSVLLHPNLELTPIFTAAIDATEEAILNALIASESAEGANRLYVPRLPHAHVLEHLMLHNLVAAEMLPLDLP
jgi:D-aminopeptidase